MKMTRHLKIQIVPQSQHTGLPHNSSNRRTRHRTAIAVHRSLHARQILVDRLLRPQFIISRLKFLVPVRLWRFRTATVAVLRSHTVIHSTHAIRILPHCLRSQHRGNRTLLSKRLIPKFLHTPLRARLLAPRHRIPTAARLRFSLAVRRHHAR